MTMLFYCQGQAGDALGTAMVMIEAATPFTPVGTAAGKGTDNTAIKTAPNVVPPKPSKAIRLAELAGKTYLDTEQDVDAYLARLKAELLKAVQTGQRLRLQ